MSDRYPTYSTVDLIVRIDEGFLFIKRKNDPYKNKWAIPGGFLDEEDESLEHAAIRELREETSLIAKIEDLEYTGVYSEKFRDPRGPIISHVYEVKKYEGKLEAKDDAKEAKIFKVIPNNLAFDHNKIMEDFLKKNER
jgi:8-oxo-dGTP diphosphatase